MECLVGPLRKLNNRASTPIIDYCHVSSKRTTGVYDSPSHHQFIELFCCRWGVSKIVIVRNILILFLVKWIFQVEMERGSIARTQSYHCQLRKSNSCKIWDTPCPFVIYPHFHCLLSSFIRFICNYFKFVVFWMTLVVYSVWHLSFSIFIEVL